MWDLSKRIGGLIITTGLFVGFVWFAHVFIDGEARAAGPTPMERGDIWLARSLECKMQSGVSTKWVNGHPQTSHAEPIFKHFYFDSIDLKEGTARVIGKLESADVSVVRTASGISFIDVYNTTTVTTTVFYVRDSLTGYVAVESLQGVLANMPLADQYYGWCAVRE